MAKQQLKLTRCTLGSDKSLSPTSDSFEAQINPAELNHSRSIAYQKGKAPGDSASQARFDRYGDEGLDFAVVFDATGAVPPPGGGQPKPVADQIEALSRVVYDYQGDKHEPGYVRVLWGSLLFQGRLESMGIHYTLFTPGGVPLRAKVSLKFTGFVGSQEAALKAGRSSPDLSHTVVVRAGDTLPLLCQSVYGDGRYYARVARFNALPGFRNLRPGTRLHFPPLV